MKCSQCGNEDFDITCPQCKTNDKIRDSDDRQSYFCDNCQHIFHYDPETGKYYNW